mmetsp:Transcript_2864/g.8668  ORF Transcript_2864/g.8668 Transcript_2864/m.8668 type:complete len:95 (-) Transcript_2864:948-1232(-)
MLRFTRKLLKRRGGTLESGQAEQSRTILAPLSPAARTAGKTMEEPQEKKGKEPHHTKLLSSARKGAGQRRAHITPRTFASKAIRTYMPFSIWRK